jgi:hypothetical protein
MSKRSNRRRWASLSALASAALAASSGSGEATIIYHAAHGVGPNASLPLPNNSILLSRRSRSRTGFPSSPVFRTYFGPKGRPKTHLLRGFLFTGNNGTVSARGVSFRRTRRSNDIAFAEKGQTFNQVGSAAGSYGRLATLHHARDVVQGLAFYNYGPRPHRFPRHFSGFSNFSDSAFRQKVQVRIDYQGSRRISYSQSLVRTGYSFVGSGKQYALFRFDVGSQTDYGWLELQLGNIGDSAPFIRLIGYAYDTSGKPIPAGAIPEPKHLPLALGALALGAVGLREWRKKRNATA